MELGRTQFLVYEHNKLLNYDNVADWARRWVRRDRWHWSAVEWLGENVSAGDGDHRIRWYVHHHHLYVISKTKKCIQILQVTPGSVAIIISVISTFHVIYHHLITICDRYFSTYFYLIWCVVLPTYVAFRVPLVLVCLHLWLRRHAECPLNFCYYSWEGYSSFWSPKSDW